MTKAERNRTHDAKRRALKASRNWYKSKLWLTRRAYQLALEPLCKRCMKRGRITAANVANHVIPHKENWTLFATGELESLCEPCHNSDAQGQEIRGYSQTIGPDGYPTDERHPFRQG